jgi:hypothetical protein
MMASVPSGYSIGRSKQRLFTTFDIDLHQSKSRNAKFSITALTLSTCTGEPAGESCAVSTDARRLETIPFIA